jgi:hypothetical protein
MDWLGQVANWRLWAAEAKKGPHPPYDIKKIKGKFYVVNALGEHKNKNGYATIEEAQKLQKALYAGLPPEKK